ncbi:MAG: acyl-CoA dehydratase activase-related protein, partial [Syntrophomonadaceae bacterium]|nr:acyl-CoA dehydratase activase-related protein [Syntrophomonadaceae bacterium]
GQDAKYTYVVNGVAVDYAMNEACSAGTGSFLEEAARESLGVDVSALGDIALRGRDVPNFNDQCAAFISSDIKTAIQEGMAVEDIAAGLVYSVCMNYNSRVKGNRPVGQKVFMQGGVCYNRAVPLAMAALTGKQIVVPPDPGLMGAFGVALEVHRRLQLGLLKSGHWDLAELAGREAEYREPFRCGGGKEKCDLGCTIQRVVIKGRTYPFGGACNRYANLVRDEGQQREGRDLVRARERLAREVGLRTESHPLAPTRTLKVGIAGSLMATGLAPLFSTFFTALGCTLVEGRTVDPAGVERKGAPFCFPVEQAHGLMASLLQQSPDVVFMPHVASLPAGGAAPAATCPFVQGEPYYLRAAFPELAAVRVLSPVLDMAAGYEKAKEAFVGVGAALGAGRRESREAFRQAVEAQMAFHAQCQAMGRQV